MARYEEEDWQSIPRMPLYEASSLGRIRSWLTPAKTRRVTPKIRKLQVGQAYYSVRIYQRTYQAHTLIARAFLGERPDGMQVRHLDGDYFNNNIGNLVYGTASENMLDKRRHRTDHNATKTHCIHGHPYSPENTDVLHKKNGQIWRRCRTCWGSGPRATQKEAS